MTQKPRHMFWVAAIAASFTVVGCGDDGLITGPDDGSGGQDSASGGRGNGAAGDSSTGGDDGSDSGGGGRTGSGGDNGGDGGNGTGGDDNGGDGGNGNGTGGDGNNGGSGGSGPGTPTCRTLPSVLSVSGCSGVGPLCSVVLDEAAAGECPDAFTANCGGALFEGQLDGSTGDFSFTGELTAANSTTTATTCAGRIQRSGQVSADCVQTPEGGAPASCSLAVNPNILPGLDCLELPKTLSGLVFRERDAEGSPVTINAGRCDVIQAGCSFQAECANDDITIVGTATATGVSFTRSLEALADAQTPNPTTTNPDPVPAFLKGAIVNHSCTATITGSEFAGACSAGATGSGANAKPATSVYDITSSLSDLPGACSLLAQETEKLFVLDSCTELKQGEGGEPGIGEPICAFRQNNCIWEVQCGADIFFKGRLQPGATKAEWRLEAGTPCEGGFDSAGNFSGKCTVPGEASCQLSSKAPLSAPPAQCEQLPADTTVTSHGCGGGSPLSCHNKLQHGCDFMAICDFSARFPKQIFVGEVSKAGGRDRMSFNGLSGYECEVEKVLESEIGNRVGSAPTIRVADEWHGQCEIELEDGTVGICRESGSFTGFRLFFGERACGTGGGVPACTPEQLGEE